MEPSPETGYWFESDPDLLATDFDTALVVVRIGMAATALSSGFSVAWAAQTSSDSGRETGAIFSFVTVAAYTFQAIDLVRSEMLRLRALAQLSGHASPALLAEIDKIEAGTHVACPVLDRVRNTLGFHWGEDVLRDALAPFRMKPSLVWVEADAVGHNVVHRLASEVLAQALFPDVYAGAGSDEMQNAITEATSHVMSATQVALEFMNATVFGYMRMHNAVLKSRQSEAGST